MSCLWPYEEDPTRPLFAVKLPRSRARDLARGKVMVRMESQACPTVCLPA